MSLIENFEIRRCLWDVNSAEYKDRRKKADAMAELAQKYGVTVDEVEKKLHTLKGQFRREHKRLTDAQKFAPKKSKWFGYDLMLFLQPVMDLKGSISTDAEDDSNLVPSTSEGEAENTDSLSETPIYQPPKREKLCSTPDDISVAALQCMKSLAKAVTKRDSNAIFADFISDSLRTASRPQHEVNLAKQDIVQIVFKLQNGLYEESSNSLFTSHSVSSDSGLSRTKIECTDDYVHSHVETIMPD